MSQRVKRPNRSAPDQDGINTVPTKRRKCRPSSTAEDASGGGADGGGADATTTGSSASMAAKVAGGGGQPPGGSGLWQPRPLNDLKISSIYNRSATEAPAELFRKDLISAMKLPDSEPLAADEYWVITDQWKQEWERGVQVPVNPESLPEPSVTVTQCAGVTSKDKTEFKLPKNKYIRITKDDQFNPEEHVHSTTPAKAEAACSYDLDDMDLAWLQLLNGERALAGLGPVSEDQLERVIEQLEVHCWDRIQSIMKNEEGLGIEYDENVICDVCRSPDSEEGNEMVFCDSCNICVHQACYGITSIPAGQWLCCTCALGQRPDCVLCPNKGGAMKCTRSGQKWAHVSCALWIPEVSIGCVEKMEPITKISSIPQSRWALICVLCRERVGACIQCSVKTCKTAYHVTCAFKHGLEMRAIIEDENADDGVKLRSYCQKHSVSSKKEKSVCSGSEDDDSKRKKRKDMTSEEKNQARAARLQEIEAEFDKHVSVKDVMQLEVDNEGLQFIYNYWKLKRRGEHNKPLLPPKSEDVDMLSHKQEQADLEKMKMFVQLRQDLERVRNLCYMVSRREKLSRSFFRMREQTFHKQASVLQSAGQTMNAMAIAAVIEANHGPSIYDRLYSHSKSEDHTADFETVLARIAGLKSPTQESGDEKKPDTFNGIAKDRKSLNNPYKRFYLNGSSSKRRSCSLYGSSLSSASSSETERKPDIHHHHHTTTDNEKVSPSTMKKKQQRVRRTSDSVKAAERRRNRLSNLSSRVKIESSSEDDIKPDKKEWPHWPRSRTLRQIEREMSEKVVSGTDSDELMPVRLLDSNKIPAAIYSDSDSSASSTKNEDKSSNAASDSQQNKMRTKAAMKEFNLHAKPSAGTSPKGTAKKKAEEEDAKKEPTTPKSTKNKKDYVPSELIVPQRQAAKKASENLKSNTSSRNKEVINTNACNETSEHKSSVPPPEEKPKAKVKSKVNKENKEVKEKETKKEAKEQKTTTAAATTTTTGGSGDVFDIDKEFEKDENQEILAYVPQRQAAKKAAEHIKSGLGSKTAVPEQTDTDSSKAKKDTSETSAKQVKASHKEPIETTQAAAAATTTTTATTTAKSNNKKEIVEQHHDKPNRISDKLPIVKRIVPQQLQQQRNPRKYLCPKACLHPLPLNKNATLVRTGPFLTRQPSPRLLSQPRAVPLIPVIPFNPHHNRRNPHQTGQRITRNSLQQLLLSEKQRHEQKRGMTKNNNINNSNSSNNTYKKQKRWLERNSERLQTRNNLKLPSNNHSEATPNVSLFNRLLREKNHHDTKEQQHRQQQHLDRTPEQAAQTDPAPKLNNNNSNNNSNNNNNNSSRSVTQVIGSEMLMSGLEISLTANVAVWNGKSRTHMYPAQRSNLPAATGRENQMTLTLLMNSSSRDQPNRRPKKRPSSPASFLLRSGKRTRS